MGISSDHFSARRARLVRFQKSIALDVIVSLLFFAFALAVRLPHFATIPVISDESREVLWGLDIARGIHFPIVATDSYEGPLFPYLLAFLFRVFGVSPELPRLFVLVCGALTVVATYWLGKIWFNRVAGVVAAMFMTTAATHIFVNSHIAWTSATTPLYTTLALIAFATAIRARSRGTWLLAGVLYGLALQTHPAVIMLAPPLVLWLLWDSRGRAWLKTPAPYLGGIGALAAYSPVLAYNLIAWGTAKASLNTALRREYAFGLPESWSDYLGRLALHASQMAKALASDLSNAQNPEVIARFTWVLVVILMVGLVVAWRRKNPLPVLTIGSTLVLLAVVYKRSYFPYDARYFSFLLPIAYAGIGLVFSSAARAIWNFDARATRARLPIRIRGIPLLPIANIARASAILLLSAVALALAGRPLQELDSVYHYFQVNRFDNSTFIEIADRAKIANPPHIWIDLQLQGSDYWMCNGSTAGEALAYVLLLNQLPVAPLSDSAPVVVPSDWLILTPDNARAWSARLPTQRITRTPRPLVHCAPERIVVLEISPPSP